MSRLRILHVEDSESDSALITRLLEKAGLEIEAERVEDTAGMRLALERSPWDAIICDYRLPALDAPEALATLKATGLDIPFIVVSGTIGEDLAVAMMRAGAHDYLLKDNLARLAPAVESVKYARRAPGPNAGRRHAGFRKARTLWRWLSRPPVSARSIFISRRTGWSGPA